MTARGGEAKPLGLVTAHLAGVTLNRKTRAKLERGDSLRSGQPVWRNSYTEGQCEQRIWRRYGDGTARTGKRLHGLIMKSARRLERETRRTRQEAACSSRRGLLGDVGLEVLDFLWSRVDFLTGRLEPAVQTIADDLGRSYSAVHRALKDLRTRGFLQWERRSKPIEEPQLGGPLVTQISNAYALLVPPGLKRFFAIEIGGRAPAPDCVTWDHEQRKAEFDRMLLQLSAKEFHHATWAGDSRLGETLANIARMVDDRESCTSRETGEEQSSS